VIATAASRLQAVRAGAVPALLKRALAEEERRGARLLARWPGDATAPVLRVAGPLLLMERARGGRDLAAMARNGDDDRATRVLVDVAQRLHAADPDGLDLVPLARRFRALDAAATRGGPWVVAARAAREAAAAAGGTAARRPLHGDLHHGNVLDFGEAGWRAIDPKGLLGDPAFDLANLLRNPDPAWAARPGRLARQARIAAEAADLPARRVLLWTCALAGLSAAWHLEDGGDPREDLRLLRIAEGELAA
jgi:streptomycin 6-kinase